MAALRNLSHRWLCNINIRGDVKYNSFSVFKRLLNYSSLEYNEKIDPRPHFFNEEVQSLLRSLTRVDLNRVFRKRKLGDKKLEDRTYKFMTDEELEKAMEDATRKADEMLQIPPIVPVRNTESKILSKDPELQGLETNRIVFTDITYGVKDVDRLIVVRETDGTLREADWEMRNRINQIYFPCKGRSIKTPKLFIGKYFEDLLDRKEYEFILDHACIQFEPNDPYYHRVVSITYQHINDNDNYELLRSTRHFGAITFFLVWHKNIDNLLLNIIETAHINEAIDLLKLYSKIHNVIFEKKEEYGEIVDYISRFSSKKERLELALQAYKDMVKQREQLEQGLKAAHGLN